MNTEIIFWFFFGGGWYSSFLKRAVSLRSNLFYSMRFYPTAHTLFFFLSYIFWIYEVYFILCLAVPPIDVSLPAA